MSIIIPIDLPGKYIEERVNVSCNFAKRLGPGVNLDDGAPIVVTAAVLTGVDANPSAILSGQPSIVGTKVVQHVIEGVDGVTYKLVFKVWTDEATPQRLIEELDLPVEEP